ncbi:aldose epimerase family protein [Streptomyces sp. P9(2023)]|uniref:aldose epimerase family protein n=1 Tax=Streptomyces sp. P9(2023) TaxID=3064394 RepID=UPI0028F42C2D|nr:aldose epimerase family protein [Streptomyces sp. P9(2023)]MDT9692185.1 aldose epimerase family protein [Streptomyces sp. P9(2023)]
MRITREPFGSADGTDVSRWTLERGAVRVRVLTYGGIVQSVVTPDRDGVPGESVLGFPDLTGYLKHPELYFGALVGRYANRIAGGSFALDGTAYRLARNGGPNCLHGGERGFDKHVWDAEEVTSGVRLSRVSPAGEEGFPGRLKVSVSYRLREDGALCIGYRAVTDAPTVVALTNHAYWRLGGGAHELRVAADRWTPTDETGVPTGAFAEVAGTELDFRTGRPPAIPLDHNFVLDGGGSPAAELYAPDTGRAVGVDTTEPGLQVYANPELGGVALETQHFPDSPNRPEFPSTVLRPDEVYMSTTVYRFGTR